MTRDRTTPPPPTPPPTTPPPTTPPTTAEPTTAERQQNPFKGLAYYAADDRRRFAGRDRDLGSRSARPCAPPAWRSMPG